MKLFPFLIFSVVWWPACAMAQVSVNAAALGQLSGVAPPPAAVAAAPASAKPRSVSHPAAVAHKKPASAAVLPVVAPLAPPKSAVLKPAPPPQAPPQSPPQAKPPAPVALSFAPGSAALPANAAAALKPFCATGFPINIGAHAPANPASPSAPMRLSLTRAFAVRDALVACGVPLAQILPLALGSAAGSDDLTRITSGPTK